MLSKFAQVLVPLLAIAHAEYCLAYPQGNRFADLQPRFETLLSQISQDGNHAYVVEEERSLIYFRKVNNAIIGVLGYGGDRYCFRGVLMNGEKIVIKKISEDYLGKRIYDLRFGMTPHEFPKSLDSFDAKCFKGESY